MRKALAVLVVAIASASFPALTIPGAHAQGSMLTPGVYTTPEISARCQSYTRARIPGGSGTMDTERQTVFLACVQRLHRDEYGGARAAALPGAVLSAPVSMSGYENAYMLGGPYQSGCITDEGYGRTGSCDTNQQ